MSEDHKPTIIYSYAARNKSYRMVLANTDRCRLHIHCVSKKFTLFVFTITKSDVDQF